jgi:zinc transporter 1/2/3
MLSIFVLFIVEIIAFRWGSAKLAALGISHGTIFFPFALRVHGCTHCLSSDPHGHGMAGLASHGPESHGNGYETSDHPASGVLDLEKERRVEGGATHGEQPDVGTSPLAQLVGIAILEFGVLLHR